MIRWLLAGLCAASLIASGDAAEIGAPVPDFQATALDGTPVSLAEAIKSHKVVVVLFLSTACPYANYFGDHLGELHRRYAPRGVYFVGVNSNQFESASDMTENAQEHRQSFSVIRDEGARIADLFGATRTPDAFVLGSDGTLRYHGWVKSKLRSPDLERALEATVSGKRVRLAETKAFGCDIDRAR